MTDKKKYSNCDQVYKELQIYFAKRNFDMSERVPSERQIADDLDVNRTTLRTAMHRMVKEGLLDRKVGVGTFFKIGPKEFAENYTKINTKCSLMELMEARMMLEPKLANLAAINASGPDIKKLRAICVLPKKLDGRIVAFIDIEFHDTIAEIAKNPMLVQMYTIISSLRKKFHGNQKEPPCESYECYEMWKEHQNNIIAALEKRDPKAAYNAVKQKLDCIFGQYSVLNQ